MNTKKPINALLTVQIILLLLTIRSIIVLYFIIWRLSRLKYYHCWEKKLKKSNDESGVEFGLYANRVDKLTSTVIIYYIIVSLED